MPDVLPSCFGEYHGSLASVANNRSSQNLVTCLYKTLIAGEYKVVSITWCKTLMGQGMSVQVDDLSCQLTCRVDMKPWLFWKKQGCKSFETGGVKVEVVWDLSSARYGSGAEPRGGYYLAILCDQNVVLLLGDMQKEALKKLHAEQLQAHATLLSRREHVSGRQIYTTRSQFFDSGATHDIAIECHTGSNIEPRLSVRVDKKIVVQVKRLMWKFRGNQTILIDGLPIEVFWDVHNWLFGSSSNGNEHAIFMFQVCKTNEKPWMRDVGASSNEEEASSSSSSSCLNKINVVDNNNKHFPYPKGLCTPVLQWPHSNSFKYRDPQQGPVGFSLLLFAWKNE